MIKKHITWAALLLLGLCVMATPAVADEPEGESVEQKIKKQMEKILKLMKENQDALLRLSSGGKDSAKKVDVKIDPPPSGSSSSSSGSSGNEGSSSGSEGSSSGSSGSEGSSSGSEGSSSGSSGSRTREEIRKAIDDLMKGREAGSKMIPGEIAKLVRMIPKGGGQGQGQGQPNEDKPGGRDQGEKQPEPDPRDGKKQLDQQQGNEPKDPQGQNNEPEGAKDKPRDPNDPMNAKKDPNGAEKPEDPDDKTDPWVARLPAELRDAVQNGDFTKIPAKYRDLVERYLKWLAKNGGK